MFVPAPYTPVFSGCHTILHRRLEEDSDSDSQSDSDEASEFDDPESWPDIFDDIDSDGNSEVEKDEITAEDEAATVANIATNIETVTSDARENDIIVTEKQEVIDDDNGGSAVTNVNVNANAPTAPPDVTVPSPPAFTSASLQTPSATTRSKQPTTITTTRRTDPIPPPSQEAVGQLGAQSDVPTTPGPKITTTKNLTDPICNTRAYLLEDHHFHPPDVLYF